MGEYTKEILLGCFSLYKKFIVDSKVLLTNVVNKNRLPNFPESISENIVKFILHKQGREDVTWITKRGDLQDGQGRQLEVKCFTSDGPSTFGPKEAWDEIYFLDASDWLNDHFVCWKVSLKNTDEAWCQFKVSKTQTFGDQCQQKRRPRMAWHLIQAQLPPEKIEKVFDGLITEL